MSSKRVAVAVRGGEKSKSTLKWVLRNSVEQGDVVVLLHVRPIIRTIPTPMGDLRPVEQLDDRIVAIYMQDVETKTNQMLNQYKRMCTTFRVSTDFNVVDHDSVGEALVEQISRLRITMFVMGAAPRCFLFRKLMGPRKCEYVATNAPNYCNVVVISNKRMLSVRNSTEQPPSSPPPSRSPIPVRRTRQVFGEIYVEEEIQDDERSDSGGTMVHRAPSYAGSSPSEKRNGEIHEELMPRTPARNLSSQSSQSQQNPVRSSRSSRATREENNIDGSQEPDARYASPHHPRAANEFHQSPQQKRHRHGKEPLIHVSSYPADPASIKSHEWMAEEHILSSHSSPGPEMTFSPADVGRIGRFMISPPRDFSREGSDYSGGSRISYQDPRVLLSQDPRALQNHDPNAESRKDRIARRIKEIETEREEESKMLEEAYKAVQEAERKTKEDEKKRKETEETLEMVNKEIEEARRLRSDAEERARENAKACRAAADELKRMKRRYREYTFRELETGTAGFSFDHLMGEGTYGTVFQGTLQNMSVAIKVLRDNVFKWEAKLQQEVELLGRIHHPHVVMLLGCCIDHGCLVYEYMANGKLEDRLFNENAPPLLWHARFRITAEVATALLFLHYTKPEPIVHRDVKPGNIFLDQNDVSKLGDVGLARLIPPKSADRLTFYARDSTPVGTLAYMDPEYQRSGIITPKSDVYSLGIVILQLLTKARPLGVIALVKDALRTETLGKILDKSAGYWPINEAKELARMALQCTDLDRNNRPDLEKVLLPCLERLRTYAEQNGGIGVESIPPMFLCPLSEEVMHDPVIAADGYTYERKEIEQWLRENDTSPMTNLVMEHKNLTLNINYNSAIKEWHDRQGYKS